MNQTSFCIEIFPAVLHSLICSYLCTNIQGKATDTLSAPVLTSQQVSLTFKSMLLSNHKGDLIVTSQRDLCLFDEHQVCLMAVENRSISGSFDAYKQDWYALHYDHVGDLWKMKVFEIGCPKVKTYTFSLYSFCFFYAFRMINEKELVVVHQSGVSIYQIDELTQLLKWSKDLWSLPPQHYQLSPQLVAVSPYLYYVDCDTGRIRGWDMRRYNVICDTKEKAFYGNAQVCGYGEEIFVGNGYDMFHFHVDPSLQNLRLEKTWTATDPINSLCFWNTARG